MAVQIQIRRDTAANFTAADPLLAQGEWALETDTGLVKIGDGSTAYNSLAYFPGASYGYLDSSTTFAGDISGLYNAISVDKASSDFQFAGDATSTDTGTVDDYALSGSVTVLRWNGASALTLDGMTGGSDGRLLFIFNVTTAYNLTIAHEAAGSTAANRFYCPNSANAVIPKNTGALFLYDATSSRWRMLGGGTLSDATPAATSTAGSAGTGTLASRDDHVHPHEAAHINHDTTWAAKGDLIVGTANDTAQVLSVGANDYVLTADSAQTTGVKWAASGSSTPTWIWSRGTDGALVWGASPSGWTANMGTASGTTMTLSRVIVPTTLVVDAGYTIETNGWGISASTSITINGAVQSNGSAGSNGSGTTGGSGGAGALPTANTGASTWAADTLTQGGRSGGAGGNSNAVGQASSSYGQVPGGWGGSGCSGTYYGGKSGQAATTENSTGARGAHQRWWDDVDTWRGLLGTYAGVRTPFSTSPFTMAHRQYGGSGGGGGAGNGSGGGGGGGGGGIIPIMAPTITVGAAGSIKANGGAGGNASTQTNYCSGGGGGGGGGIIGLVYRSYTNSGTVEAAGGDGGTGAAGGTLNAYVVASTSGDLGATQSLTDVYGTGAYWSSANTAEWLTDIGKGSDVGQFSPLAYAILPVATYTSGSAADPTAVTLWGNSFTKIGSVHCYVAGSIWTTQGRQMSFWAYDPTVTRTGSLNIPSGLAQEGPIVTTAASTTEVHVCNLMWLQRVGASTSVQAVSTNTSNGTSVAITYGSAFSDSKNMGVSMGIRAGSTNPTVPVSWTSYSTGNFTWGGVQTRWGVAYHASVNGAGHSWSATGTTDWAAMSYEIDTAGQVAEDGSKGMNGVVREFQV